MVHSRLLSLVHMRPTGRLSLVVTHQRPEGSETSSRVLGPMASRTAARASTALDRPGGRWALGLSTSVAISLAERRPCRVRWDGSAWSHRFAGQTVLNDRILRPSRSVDAHMEIFLWDYAPARGQTVVDIGAGTGTEVVGLAQRVGPRGRVIAVEAHPAAAMLLERIGPINGLANIEVVSMAIADKPGLVTISEEDEGVANHLFGAVSSASTVEVPATTIDDLLDDLQVGQVDLLKMNIEGAERLAVRGMERSAPRIDHVAISCHDFLGTDWGRTRDEVAQWLEEHGYRVRRRTDDPRPWARDYLYGSRTT